DPASPRVRPGRDRCAARGPGARPVAPGRRQHADQGAGRPWRRGDQARAARGRHAARLAHPRHLHHLEDAEPQQALGLPCLARPACGGGGEAPCARRGDAGGKLPPRRAGGDGPGAGGVARGQPAARHRAHQRLGAGWALPAQAGLRHAGRGLCRLRRGQRLRRPRAGAAADVHGRWLCRALWRGDRDDRAAPRGGDGAGAGDRPDALRSHPCDDGAAACELADHAGAEAAHRQPQHQCGAAQRLSHQGWRLGLPLRLDPGNDGEAAAQHRPAGADRGSALPHQCRPGEAWRGARCHHRGLYRRAEPGRGAGAFRRGGRHHRAGHGCGDAGGGRLRDRARGGDRRPRRGDAGGLAADAWPGAAALRDARHPGASGSQARRTQRGGARAAPRRGGACAAAGRGRAAGGV
ncbi:MAG: hypothetical protein AVDCRST_MAG27-4313, partial [uncultured Craurococcus sp.]